MPFLALILQGIPEQISLINLAFVIAQVPTKWKPVCIGGTIMAFTVYAIRTFGRPLGTHTVVLVGLIFFILVMFGKAEITRAIIASLLSMLFLIIFELVCVSSLMAAFHITDDIITTNTTLRILISLPQVVLMFISAFVLSKVKSRGGINVHRNQ